jgi:hypothetical protein
VALTSHSSKAATRVAINQSPEPLSNVAMSLIGDLAVPFGVWFSFKYPVVVLALVLVFLAVFAWMAPKVYRLVKRQWLAMKSWLAPPPVER